MLASNPTQEEEEEEEEDSYVYVASSLGNI
jgi:hypothetical protein